MPDQKLFQALVIIDAQENMFDEGFPIYQRERILTVLSSLLEKARQRAVPVVFVRNNGSVGEVDEPGTPGWEIHHKLQPKPTETVVDKAGPDAFENTDLGQLLDERQIKHLIIAGMQTEMCIAASLRKSIELGYQVTLVADGHSTFDFEDLNAAEAIQNLHDEFNSIVRIEKADRIEFLE